MEIEVYRQPWKLLPNQIRAEGGRELDQFRGIYPPKDIPNGSEAWVGSVTRANGATIAEPDFGCSKVMLPDGSVTYLFQAIAASPEKTLGLRHIQKFGNGLGMLVKLLDAKNQYLLQCHPTCEVARKIWNSEYGKEECWYVLSVREDAIEAPSILLGFKEGVTREAFEREYRSGNLKAIEAMCHKISVAAGDAFFVPGGTPHALGAGCFVVEVQEPSDLTAVPIPQQALLDYRRKAAPNGIFVPEDEALYENRMLDSFVYQGSPLVHVLRRNRSSAEILRSGEWGKEISIFGREHTRLFSCTRADVLGKMPLFDTGSIQIGIVIKGSGSLESGGDMLQVRRGDELFFPFAMDPTVVSGDLSLVLCNPGNVDY